MIKRVIDFLCALLGLVLLFPVLLTFTLLVYLYDKSNPFYVAERVGKFEVPFKMIKLRSMVINADSSGLASTSNADRRITPVGHYIRKYKLDEFTQLWNVLLSDMSLVGPRPNVKTDVNLYTDEERKLLNISPGITDIASIVYSDEGDILDGYEDADKAYQQLIRPGKGALGLFYVNNRNTLFDFQLIFATMWAIISKESAITYLIKILKKREAPKEILDIVSRKEPLTPKPPVGSNQIFETR